MGRITNLLIGILVVSFIFTGLILFMADTSVETGQASLNASEYNETYNKISRINELNKEITEQGEKDFEQSTSDILGSYFKQGYSALRLTLESGKLASDMVNSAQKDTKLNEGSGLFFPMIAGIITLIVIFSIIIYAVVGRDV